jgi:hypothetical protein
MQVVQDFEGFSVPALGPLNRLGFGKPVIL